MSEAVTRAAYRFVDALNDYNEANSVATDELLESDEEIFEASPETQERWDASWEEYQDARDNLIDTVRVDRLVKLG